jgi:hypothetical protein
MAIVLGALASFENGASFLEVMVDDADIDPDVISEDPLAGARVRSARIVSSLTRGIWVLVTDTTRPNPIVIDVFGRGKVVEELTFELNVGRRINLGQISFSVGSE